MKRELRDKIRIARKYGFELVRDRKHLIFKHPNGSVVTASNTPSDPRGSKNFELRLKRGSSQKVNQSRTQQ